MPRCLSICPSVDGAIGRPLHIGNTRSPSPSDRAASRTSTARSQSGTRCSRFAFIRSAEIVHTRPATSISPHVVSRTSADRPAVSTSSSNASLTAGVAESDARTVATARPRSGEAAPDGAGRHRSAAPGPAGPGHTGCPDASPRPRPSPAPCGRAGLGTSRRPTCCSCSPRTSTCGGRSLPLRERCAAWPTPGHARFCPTLAERPDC